MQTHRNIVFSRIHASFLKENTAANVPSVSETPSISRFFRGIPIKSALSFLSLLLFCIMLLFHPSVSAQSPSVSPSADVKTGENGGKGNDGVNEDVEKTHLKLYASFDDGIVPEIAEEGVKALAVKRADSQENAGTLPVIPAAEGKFGDSLHFSASENPDDLLYDTGTILAGTEWTVACWLKLDEAGNAHYGEKGPGRGLFRTNMGWESGNAFASFDAWGTFHFTHFDGAKKSCGAALPSAAFQAQKWIHAAFTFQDGKHRVFLNGNEASYSRNSDCTVPPPPSGILRVGSMDFRSHDFLNGCIDELKLFDKALNSEEIRNIMTTTPGKKQNLRLYLPLDGEITGEGFTSFSASELIYADGKSGKGAKFIRHGYDRYCRLALQNVISSRQAASVIFYFLPDWDGTRDSAIHGLFHFQGEGLEYDLTVRNQKLVFSVRISGGKESTNEETRNISLDAGLFQKGTRHRIAAGYDVISGRMFLSIDENTVEESLTFPTSGMRISGSGSESEKNSRASFETVSGTVTLGNTANTDTYSRTQAEGVLDEILLLDGFLTPVQLEKRLNSEIRRNAHRQKTVLVTAPVQEQEKELWKLAGAERSTTAVRERITLNALWRMQLTDEKRPYNPQDWQYLAVPGRFSGQANGMAECEFFMRDKTLKILSSDAKYDGRSPYDFVNGWFERAFIPSPSWKGREILLQIQELGTSETGTVYLNGKVLAELNRGTMFEIRIPEERLKFGEYNFLTIHTSDAGQYWAWRGIKGDVSLEIRNPISARYPVILTSVKEKRLKYEITLTNHSSSEAEIFAEASFSGRNAPSPLRTAGVRLAPGASQTVEAEVFWPDAELWSHENPYLYTCTFRILKAAEENETSEKVPKSVKSVPPGKNVHSEKSTVSERAKKTENAAILLDEMFPIRFGFREFEIRGRDFYLNGNKIHLFTHDSWANSTCDEEEARQVARTLKKLGFNSVRTNFGCKDIQLDTIMKVCDEEGLLQLVGVEGVSSSEYVLWNDPDVRQNLEERMASLIRRWQNHPSNVIWFLSYNFLGYGWDYHPMKMADGYLPDFMQEKFKICDEGVKILRKYDAVRPYFFQAGGNFGEIHTTNAYFCWWPQTERNAWPAEWSKIGKKPLHIIETSFPYFQSFYGMDRNYPGNRPLFFFENLARYYGPDAYKSQDAEMILQLKKSAHGENAILWNDSPDLQKLKGDLILETIPNWRNFSLSGICPFAELSYAFEKNAPFHSIFTAKSWNVTVQDFRKFGWSPDLRKIPYQADIACEKPLPVADALRKAFAPQLILLDGGGEDPVNQAFSYASGGVFRKRLVFMNDTLHPAVFSGYWKLGETRKSFRETLNPGEIRRLSVETVLPEVKTVTTLKFIVKTEESPEKSPFIYVPEPRNVVIYPPVEKSGFGEIFLYDTVGKTAATLRKLGIPFKLLKEKGTKPGAKTESGVTPESEVNPESGENPEFEKGLLILGTECLTPEFYAAARKWKLAEKLNSGSVRLFIAAQTPEALKSLGMRTQAIYARQVFQRDGTALGPWCGKTTFSPEKQLPSPETETQVASPLWHWTGTNVVSSYPLLRPSEGAFDVLLTCGKDLIYTPLLEMKAGKGRIVFCQLEIENRTEPDPQAEYFLSTFLRDFSVMNFKKNSTKFISAEELPVSVLRKKVSDGGCVILDARFASEFQLQTESRKISGFRVTEAGESVFSMLSARDCFFRASVEMTVFSGDGLVPLTEPAFAAQKTLGKGKIIFLGLPSDSRKEERERGMKNGTDSSELWSAEILENRLHQIRALCGRALGEKTESISARFEGEKPASDFPYRYNTSKYCTEKHVRW